MDQAQRLAPHHAACGVSQPNHGHLHNGCANQPHFPPSCLCLAARPLCVMHCTSLFVGPRAARARRNFRFKAAPARATRRPIVRLSVGRLARPLTPTPGQSRPAPRPQAARAPGPFGTGAVRPLTPSLPLPQECRGPSCPCMSFPSWRLAPTLSPFGGPLTAAPFRGPFRDCFCLIAVSVDRSAMLSGPPALPASIPGLLTWARACVGAAGLPTAVLPPPAPLSAAGRRCLADTAQLRAGL